MMKKRLLHLLAGTNPVLIVGCHRSGTSFLAKLCSGAGLFLGSDLFENHESNRFMQLHDQLLSLTGSHWNDPRAFLERFGEDPDFAQLVDNAIIRDILSPGFFHRFHGYRNYLAGHLAGRRPWGWKDPRTLLLITSYLRIFPGCSVLHLCRNGIDVAASLVQRDLAEEGGHGVPGGHPQRLETAFDTWTCYEKSILEAVEKSAHPSYLRIRFEDLVCGQGDCIEELNGFLAELGLTPLETASRRSENAWKFKASQDLVDFYLRKRDAGPMATYGYSDIFPR